MDALRRSVKAERGGSHPRGRAAKSSARKRSTARRKTRMKKAS
jgi:hypothetical protein